MILCPITARTVPTGMIAADIRAFAAMGIANMPLTCSACGKIHRWSIADAWLEPGTT